MKEKNYGRIVNVASPSGLFGNFGQSNYGAAKMGIVGLTNVLAIEGAKNNIKVNVIAPTAYTRMTEALLPDDVGKLFRPELVSPMVVYLASEACEPTHEIFGVAAGRFARIGIITHSGYVNTAANSFFLLPPKGFQFDGLILFFLLKLDAMSLIKFYVESLSLLFYLGF